MATIKDRYILDVETRGSGRRISDLNSNVRRLDSSLRGIKGAAGAAVGALTAFGAINLAQNAVETYTEFENLTTQIATYTGGLENARAELSKLENLSTQLPQDLNDLAAAFTILTRTGIDTSADSLRAFSEIAAANGKSIEQLAEAVADGMTGEFERFKEFGIKVTKEGDQLTARIGDQTVAIADSSQQLVEQLVSLGEEGGRFFGAAAANSETLSQSFSNLNGAVSIAERSFVEGLKPGLQAATEAFTTLITENKGLIEGFGELVGSALQRLPELFGTVSEAVKPLEPVFSLLATVISDFLWPAIKKLFEILGALAEVLTPIVENLVPVFQTGLEAIVAVVKTVVQSIQTLIEGLTNMWNKAKEIAGGVKESFNSMKDSVVDSAQGAYDGVTGWFGEMYDEVVGNSIVPDMAEAVVRVFDQMGDGMVRSIQNSTRQVNEEFRYSAGQLTTDFTNYAGTAFNGIDGLINELTGGLLDRITGLARDIGGIFGNLGSVFGNIFSGTGLGNIFSSLESGFSGIVDGIRNTIGNLTGGLGSTVSNLANSIGRTISGVKDVFSGGIGNLSSGIGNVVSGISNTVNRVKDVFSGGLGGVISNIGSGIKNTVSKIGDFFGGFFATGGFLPAGKLGIVGERGPELITGPANVTPGNFSRAMQVTINAVDAASFQALVASDPEFIYSVAQKGSRSFAV